MKTTLSLLFLFLAGTSFTAIAQQKIIAMSMMTTIPVSDTSGYGVPLIDSTTLFTATMTVILDNTDSIYQLHVKLGSAQGGSDILSADFDYGASGTFGST